MACFL